MEQNYSNKHSVDAVKQLNGRITSLFLIVERTMSIDTETYLIIACPYRNISKRNKYLLVKKKN